MSQTTIDPGVREALVELQMYLSDELAPMMVTDSVEVLLRQPPALVANEIHAWVENQISRGGAGFVISDCLFHSIKKIHLMSEFDLVVEELLYAYLQELGNLLLELCPPQDREYLRENIVRLGKSEAGGAAGTVDVIYKQALRPDAEPTHMAGSTPAGVSGVPAAVVAQPAVTPEAVAAGTAPAMIPVPAAAMASAVPSSAVSAEFTAEMARGIKRFGLLMERLGQSSGGAPEALSEEVVPTVIANAAAGARSPDELATFMEQIRSAGVETTSGNLFRSLGRSLPGWAVPFEGNSPALAGNKSVQAMHKLIAMAADPEEGARRFKEMMEAAIERFNDGALGQAVTMFELAERIIGEKQLGQDVVTSIRRKAHEPLDGAKLKEFADQQDKHIPLRTVLQFFPALTYRGLLESLKGEPKRERRRLQLSLLEVHGLVARNDVMGRLGGYADVTDPQGFFLRNLVYLMRRIPRPEDASQEQEIALLVPLTEWNQPLLVIKESLTALGGYSEPQAERILTSRISELENMLQGGEELPCGADEMRGLLDRSAAALARIGSVPAVKRLVQHALTRNATFGETLARLEDLSGRDLSAHLIAVEQLLAALKAELPSKVLGFVMNKRPDGAFHILHALGSTPLPAVREMLESVVSRFDDDELGEVAAKILAGFGVRARSTEETGRVMSGDVELFGLPNLLQTLGDSKTTGVLTLNDTAGDLLGTLCFDEGTIVDSRHGVLRGPAAFYQFFERPEPGTFVFRGRKLTAKDTEGAQGDPMEVLPGLMEAMRRHDEYQEACVVVPDDTPVTKGEGKPTVPEDEEDRDFIRRVWVKASSGATPADTERTIPVDGFRIRRLYAHWIEGGALAVRPA